MINADNAATIVLGDEYNSDLRVEVIKILKDMGAIFGETTWGVAGSQELNTLEIEVLGKPIILEAETFVGLTIQGDQNLITNIADRVKSLGYM